MLLSLVKTRLKFSFCLASLAIVCVSSQDIVNAIMGKCDNFFGMVLPSSSLLILDFIHAANTIIENANTAVSLLFSK